MIELEKTYLAKSLPEGLASCRHKEIVDVYIPASAQHPKLRLRKSGEKYEMTKKVPVSEGDASEQKEHTIPLNEKEFAALMAVDGKKVRKLRYYFEYKGRTAEVDVFQDVLEGLVVIDFEFETREEKEAFEMPEFCLEDITQEDFIAGGMICGKSYGDIQADLDRFEYQRLQL